MNTSRGETDPSAEQAQDLEPRPTISIVIPTRNESENIRPLVSRLAAALPDVDSELVFVDDSDDDTPEVIQACGDLWPGRLRLLHRPPNERRGGLSTAVKSGMRVAEGEWVSVMDADLQHPPELVPVLLASAREAACDLAVASRRTTVGSDGNMSSLRAAVSHVSGNVARVLFPKRLRDIHDPMSGFFLVRREAIDLENLRPTGFKILLEILVRTPGLSRLEVPFEFGERHAGTSKASMMEGLRFTKHLARLRLGGSAKLNRTTYNYDIHGILTVTSDARLPELDRFMVASLDASPSIRVICKHRAGRFDQHNGRARYAEIDLHFGFGIEIEAGETVTVWTSWLLRHSPHVLYTNVVEPILRWRLVQAGYALVHGACIVDGDEAFVITARTDTGKTTTMLKVLDQHAYEFLSDDLTLVDKKGRVLTYPKPLTISNHTLHAIRTPLLSWTERLTLPIQSRLHSRGGRKVGFAMARLGLPVATLNAITQALIPPPKYHVERLIPGARKATNAHLAGLMIIERGGHELIALSRKEALQTLYENCEDAYGFPPYHTIEEFLHSEGGQDLRVLERAIISKAFRGVPAALIRSTTMNWAARVPEIIAELGSGETTQNGTHDLDAQLVVDLRSNGSPGSAESRRVRSVDRSA